MIEKHALLMHYYTWSYQFCRTGICSARSQVFYNRARAGLMAGFGAVWDQKSPGYIRQHIDRKMKEQNNG